MINDLKDIMYITINFVEHIAPSYKYMKSFTIM